MGINGLLRFMKPHVQSVHIKKYSGKRVGIDAYSWLHKGAYSCSMELYLNTDGDKKSQYLKYFMHRINMLRHHKITPVVVFDGGNIPCKAATEDERHRRRKANRDMAMEKLKEGNANAASELFQRAVSITPLMAHQLIQILRLENIEFVVAPYEADAQLAYLSGLEAEEGGVVAVISEDSDLLAYGCPAVVFKMDRYGNGEEIVLDKVFNTVGCVPSFKSFDRELLTGMCVLAGCDFLPSVPGVGIARAHNLVAKYRNFSRILSVLRFEKGKKMPEDYSEVFKEAAAVFRHALVYDAAKKQLKHLKPLTLDLLQNEDKNLDFLGPDLPPSLAIAIAQGNLDPCTMEAFDHFPQPRNQFNLNSPDSASRFLRQEEATESAEGKLTDDVPTYTVINGLAQQKPTIDAEEVLHSREILSLKSLVFASNNEASTENVKTPSRLPSKTPNNNPFKKRKLEQVQTAEVDERVSTVTEIESLGPIVESYESINSKHSALLTTKVENISRKLTKHRHCTADSSAHVVSGKLTDDVPTDTAINGLAQRKPTVAEEVLHSQEILSLKSLVFASNNEASTENIKTPSRLPSKILNNPFKKRKLEQVQTAEVDERVSTVTEIESLGPIVESHASINSKHSALLTTKVENISRKLPKHRHCTAEVSKNTSILNFYSRV